MAIGLSLFLKPWHREPGPSAAKSAQHEQQVAQAKQMIEKAMAVAQTMPPSLANDPKLKADAKTLATIRSELGLDQPLPVQYARYLERLMHGDFGRSYLTRQDVLQAILERLPATA